MRLLFPLLLMFTALPVFAQTPPIPAHHPIKEMESKLEAEREATQALEREIEKLQKDIGSGKEDMLGLAADIKQNEEQLSKTEARLKELQAEQDAIQQRLDIDQDQMADLILALQRIRRVPPEALLARPGAPLETAQSAMLLEHILPGLYDRAEGLKGDLARLADIVGEVEQKRTALKTKSIALQAQQYKMGELVDARQKLVKETQGDFRAKQAEIEKISAQSANLKDLIKKLDARKEAQAKITTPRKKTTSAAMPKPGSGQLPVSGIVRVRYGERDDIGARSEGIRIEGRNGALVVAPLGGIVRYSSDFRNYGKMVIIEHKDGYHSLVAGLARIDTVEGQSLVAGEPVGILGAGGGKKPALYYELRLNGHPINPARKIGDLG